MDSGPIFPPGRVSVDAVLDGLPQALERAAIRADAIRDSGRLPRGSLDLMVDFAP